MNEIYENVRLQDLVSVLLCWYDVSYNRHFWSLRRFLVESWLWEAKVVNAGHGDVYHVRRRRRRMMMGANECFYDDDHAGEQEKIRCVPAGPKPPAERLDMEWWLAGIVSGRWTGRSQLIECWELLSGNPEWDMCVPCTEIPGGSEKSGGFNKPIADGS